MENKKDIFDIMDKVKEENPLLFPKNGDIVYCRRDMRSQYGVCRFSSFGKMIPSYHILSKEYKKLSKEDKKCF